MTAPEPYRNGTHLVVRGRTFVVVNHAPNADGWKYHGTPSDLAGDDITFSHSEATPVTRPLGPRSVGGMRDLIGSAGLDPDIYEQEIAQLQAENEEHPRTPIAELLAVVRSVAHGYGGQLDIHEAWKVYTEATS